MLDGCGTVQIPQVVTHYEPGTGRRTDMIPDNLLETAQQPPRELVWLNASRVFRNRVDFDYYLEVHYEAREETGLLDIKPGPSLVVVADGHEMQFSGSGSLNARRSRQELVSEDALYPVSVTELRNISRAKEVKVKVTGVNGIVEREFAAPNFERFKKFVHHYVEGN